MWEYWRGHRAVLILLVVMTCVSTTVALAYPLVFRSLLDRLAEAIGSEDASGLRSLLFVLALIALGRMVAAFYPALRARMNLRFEVDIREHVFGRILRKDHRFFTRFRTGDVVTRLTDDVADYPKVTWFMCSGVFRALDSASKLVFCATAMLLLHTRLTALAVVPVVPLLLFFYWVRKALYEAFEAQQTAISTTNSMLESVFTGIRIVKGFTNEAGQGKRLARILGDRVGVQLRVAKLHVLFHSLERITGHVGQVIVLAAGGVMVIRGELSAGTLYALYVYLDMLVYPIMDLPNLLVSARQAFVCMDRIEEVASFPVRVQRRQGQPGLDRLERVELRDVWASYDDGSRPVLRGVSLRVAAGEKLALVGPVGCGKTTVLKLLAGLMTPEKGEILVNGAALECWDWEAYRRTLGYVPQDTLLFSESIVDNVSCGRRLSAERILGALEIAQVRAEVERMTKGADTVLSTKGHSLSGGQRGRVAIARAVAGEPELFLFDDCTAALDARSEDGFWRSVLHAYPDATYVIVSHRIATIRRAERVVFLIEGQIAAEGSHDGLLQTCPAYTEFIAREELLEHLGVA
jgi:ATP-binding cassette subfamily B multidrug efflux pump